VDLLQQWLAGEVTSATRVLSVLAPAILIIAYFVIGGLIYGVRRIVLGPYRDAEMEARGDSALLTMGLRRYFYWLIQPPFKLICRIGLPADAITTLSVLVALASGAAFAAGKFGLGGWLYIFSGILDVLDGRLARASGQSSPHGAALDSILDRYADAVVLMGLAWFYRDSWVLAVVLAALTGSLLTSYVRARGEGLGLDVKVGLMQRPERIVTLGLTTAFAPIVAVMYEPGVATPMHWLAVVGLVFLAVASQLTAAWRFAYVLSALNQSKDKPTLLDTGHGGLIRSVISAVVATGADFTAVLFMVDSFGLSPWTATALGCGVGAIVNFAINRIWAFEPTGDPVRGQAGRYAFVSGTSLGLNAGGVAVLMLLPGIDYRLAWGLVRGAVFVFWNYPLHRDYVFVDAKPARATPTDAITQRPRTIKPQTIEAQ
jgi:phosphatidylglycerophosphate synthase/putative flippase GtrA